MLIGRNRSVALVGEGGMGQVYLADDLAPGANSEPALFEERTQLLVGVAVE